MKFLTWCLDHWGLTAFVIAGIIQITPAIKWNPLTAFCRWVGKLITAPVTKELDSIKQDIKRLQSAQDDNEKDRIRWEVLDFANSCRNGRRHSKDEFQHIIALNDKYKALLEKTHDKNGVFDEEYCYIKQLYAERQRKNDFLC